MRTQDYKARIEEILDNYEEAMDEKFSEEFITFIKPYLADNDVISYSDVQGFIDSFEQPDPDEWAAKEAQSQYETYQDQQYDLLKDK